MPGRVRHRLDQLTPYERSTATLCLGGDKWGRVSGRALSSVLRLFAFAPGDALALSDVLRDVEPPLDRPCQLPEETVREALRDPAGGLILRYEPEADRGAPTVTERRQLAPTRVGSFGTTVCARRRPC